MRILTVQHLWVLNRTIECGFLILVFVFFSLRKLRRFFEDPKEQQFALGLG